jgi:hypothetical protein
MVFAILPHFAPGLTKTVVGKQQAATGFVFLFVCVQNQKKYYFHYAHLYDSYKYDLGLPSNNDLVFPADVVDQEALWKEHIKKFSTPNDAEAK